MSESDSLYHEPSIRPPTRDVLKRIAEKHGLSLDERDLEVYRRNIAETCVAISEVDATLPEPTLPTLYPRTPGYRPNPEENKLNGWYWRTDIKGAEGGKLSGRKVALKDIIAVAGVPMNLGCAATEGYTPEYDATVVTRILNEGGHIIGKATCGSLCDSGTGFTSVKGPVKNAHNPLHDAGGSSGGCATLIASGEVDLAVGSDQGGSVRMPAGWCGIVGLKPTYGLIPYTGTVAFESSVDHLGPMARNVYDCALLTEVLAGYDNGLDPRQRPDVNIPEYTKKGNLEPALPGIAVKFNDAQPADSASHFSRISRELSSNVLKEGFAHGSFDQRVNEIVRAAVLKLGEVGADVEDVSIPLHTKAPTLFKMVCIEDSADTLFRTGGAGSGLYGFRSTSLSSFVLKSLRSRINDISHSTKSKLLLREYLSEFYPGVVHNKGQNMRRLLAEKYNEALANYDVLAMPTLPFTAPKLPSKNITTEEYLDRLKALPLNTMPFNLTGHPAISLNAGYHDNGLPVGVMFVAKHFDEVTIFKVANVFEKNST